MKNERPRTFSPLSTAWLQADEQAADIQSSRPCSTKTDLKSYTDRPHLPEFHISPCALFLQVWLGLRLLKIMFGLHLTPDLWGKINTLSLSEVLFSWKSTLCFSPQGSPHFFFSLSTSFALSICSPHTRPRHPPKCSKFGRKSVFWKFFIHYNFV